MTLASNAGVRSPGDGARGAAPLSGLWAQAMPLLAILATALLVPLVGNDYWLLIASRAAIYWVLIAGLNLVVGFAGQLAIGYVSFLTLGAYTAAVLAAGNVSAPWPAFAAMAAAMLVGAFFGGIIGLPALRLRTFYYAITTLGFSTIVTQIALAWQSVTGGGIGVTGPELPAPFNTPVGFYYFCLLVAAVATWLSFNLVNSRVGRALVAVRDAEVASEASGVSKARVLLATFVFSGALAGIAGALFASLQTYITPDAFTFDLSVLFFIAVLIGGRGSILGPMLGTILLTLLPEFAAPLAAWSTFFYALLLLVVVLAAPGGIAALVDFKNRKPLVRDQDGQLDFAMLTRILGRQKGGGDTLALKDIALAFGGVRALDGVDIVVAPGQIHGLIGPNGSGKTTLLNVISGYYGPQRGEMRIGSAVAPLGISETRANLGIARTFQTPRIVGEATVIDNVMIGGWKNGRASFLETVLALPRQRSDERSMRQAALDLLRAVGLESVAGVRADRLQHSELRFVEIARALMLQPRFLLLDEPAAGLAHDEIERLAALITQVGKAGIGVLLVEHHADMVFETCDAVTVLNLGKVLAQGTPADVRVHKEVVSAYLGS